MSFCIGWKNTKTKRRTGSRNKSQKVNYFKRRKLPFCWLLPAVFVNTIPHLNVYLSGVTKSVSAAATISSVFNTAIGGEDRGDPNNIYGNDVS